MLVEFYKKYQNDKQTASDYFSDLFVEIGEEMKYGGLNVADMPKVLLKQFISGTLDEELLIKLRLEDKVDNPPPFLTVLASIRREECRRTERKLRHRKQARVDAVIIPDAEDKSREVDAEIKQLRQRLAELETGGTQSEKIKTEIEDSSSFFVQLQQRVAAVENQLSGTKCFVFCYRCGEDAHLATACTNMPNKELVDQKVAERRKTRKGKN